MLEDALELAATFGFRILPVSSPLMAGPVAGKRPLISSWQGAATTDPDQIRAWFHQWPQANIGIAMVIGKNLARSRVIRHSVECIILRRTTFAVAPPRSQMSSIPNLF